VAVALRSSWIVFLAAVLSTQGCSAFRAQFGGGIGLGVDVKIPGLLHTGLDAGQFMNLGVRYDTPELSHDASATLVAWHWEGRESRRPEQGHKLLPEHQCWAALPPLTTVNNKDGQSVWDFEIGIMLLVMDFRLGFNPLRWDNPDKRPRERPPVANPLPPPPQGELPASAPGPSARPARPEPSVYERDPLLPAGDPPSERE
jgi:hypothetical protein